LDKMGKKYRAVLVGLGNIAWRFDQKNNSDHRGLTHASSYLQDDRVEIVGGCAPEPDDRKSFEKVYKVPTYKTIEEMLPAVKPHVVSICTPADHHYSQVMYCLQQSIPMIWLEKPPTTSLADLDSLIQENGRLLGRTKILVNYQRRFSPSYNWLQSMYKDQILGNCRLIQINYSRGLENNGSHLLDILFFIVGAESEYRLEWVSDSRSPSPSFALTFQNSFSVFVSGVELPYHNIDIMLTFDLGRASVLYGGMAQHLESRIENDMFPGFFRLSESKMVHTDGGEIKGSMAAALNDLIGAYEDNREPRSSLVTARRTQMLMEEIRSCPIR
jgi:predicted dehydrogenase